MSLATTNSLLGNANWESASVKELVATALEPYCPPNYDGCEFSGIELRVPGSIVTSLTMVLHELAVNAAKHGALKSKGGRLKVAWQHENHSSGTQLNVSWEEVTCTASAPDKSSGYGTALIDTTIASLGGLVERAHKDGLFAVRFTIPLA